MAERGEMLVSIGDPHGDELLEEAVARKPSLPFAQMTLAQRYRMQGEDERYVAAMVKAIEADADLVFATYYGRIVDSIARPEEFWSYIELFGLANPMAHIADGAFANERGRPQGSTPATAAAGRLPVRYRHK